VLVPLLVGHLLDIVTTAIGLRLGIPESNPFLASVMRQHGELAMYGLKALLVAWIVLAVLLMQRRYRHAWPVVVVSTIPVVLVVVNNLALIAEAHA
jgi:hypothetical protein